MMRRRPRGIALVMVLWTVALLATVTAMASTAARSSAAVAANTRSQSVARAMAESGVIAGTTLIDDSLRVFANDRTRRDDFLARLEPALASGEAFHLQDTLSDGVFAVTVVDVSARLDVNDAGADGLATLFATVAPPSQARRLAERLDGLVRGEASMAAPQDDRLRARDSLDAALLGREASPRRRRPFESLDDVEDVAGADAEVLARVATQLTVDGDGRTNRRGASRAVLAAATGSLVDAPSRLLFVARGWQRGHPLSRQIEALYDVTDDGLHLVRWRERER